MRPLHLCAFCRSDLVHLLDRRPAGPRHHQLTLRCPECERVRTGVFASAEVARLDAEQARAATTLAEQLARVQMPERGSH